MDFNVNLDRNVRRKIFFGKVCPKSIDGSSCIECEKASEFYRAANNASSKDERNSLMEKARILYARSKIFVNAIDTQDEDKSYPVRIYAIPPSTYDDLMRQVKGLNILDNTINVVHPFKGRNVLITKKGQGVQTRYSVQIDTRDTEIPNKQLLEQFKNGDLSGLHNLNNIIDFINQNYMYIKQLDSETNILRFLPPYDESKVIFAEVKFHRYTADYILSQGVSRESSGDFDRPSTSYGPSNSSNNSTVDEYDPFGVSDEPNVATPSFTAPADVDVPHFSSTLIPEPATQAGNQTSDPFSDLDISRMSADTLKKIAARMGELDKS